MAGVCDGLQVRKPSAGRAGPLASWGRAMLLCGTWPWVLISRVLGILVAVFFPSGPQVLFHPTQSGSLPFSLDKHLG